MTPQRRAQIEIRKMKLPIRYTREARVQREFSTIRRELGLSQAAMGELMGVNQKTISNWETGNASPIFNRGYLLYIWWRGPIPAALIANRVIQKAFKIRRI